MTKAIRGKRGAVRQIYFSRAKSKSPCLTFYRMTSNGIELMKPAWLHLLEENADDVRPGTSTGVGQTSDDSILRAKARELIEAGNLPNRRPDRMWGGPSVGAQCTICGAPVKQDELELEMEFIPDAGPGPSTHHVHIRCFSALEFEMRSRQSDGDVR
jgi:hypothetical protein